METVKPHNWLCLRARKIQKHIIPLKGIDWRNLLINLLPRCSRLHWRSHMLPSYSFPSTKGIANKDPRVVSNHQGKFLTWILNVRSQNNQTAEHTWFQVWPQVPQPEKDQQSGPEWATWTCHHIRRSQLLYACGLISLLSICTHV